MNTPVRIAAALVGALGIVVPAPGGPGSAAWG